MAFEIWTVDGTKNGSIGIYFAFEYEITASDNVMEMSILHLVSPIFS